MNNETSGQPERMSEIFWGEIAPCEHLVQIYENDDVVLDALEGFVGGGIRAGEGVIVIATPDHLRALEHRMDSRGIDVDAARICDQYIPLDVHETLAKFMVNRWPNEELFEEVVNDLIDQARGTGRRVRAFGEMVALLWAQGSKEAVVRLEHLWHRLCHERAFSLFCAYPRIGFSHDDVQTSVQEICAAHSRVLTG